jgi:hypothetical protein
VRVQDEETCEAEYWDEYLREFGRAAYIEARYQAQSAVELEPGAYDSGDLDRIHSLSHERLRRGSRRSKAEQKRDSRWCLVDGQKTGSGEAGRAPSSAPLNAHPLAGARQSAGLLEMLGRRSRSSVHPQATCRPIRRPPDVGSSPEMKQPSERRAPCTYPDADRQQVASFSNVSHPERRDQ